MGERMAAAPSTGTKLNVIVDPCFRTMDRIFHPRDRQRLEAVATVVWAKDEPMPGDLFERAIADADVLVTADWARYSPGFVDRAPKLKAIVDVGGSFLPGLDYGRCFARSIRVTTCSPAFAPAVAELALGMAIAAAREIVARDRELRAGTESWDRREESASTFSLFGQCVGLIGFGAIARQLLALLKPFGCRVRVYDPWLPDFAIRDAGCEPVSLEELLAGAKAVFVLAVPTPENRALLDRDKLLLMQPGSLVVLMSRAHLVDFAALTELAAAGRLKAAIDVFPAEPLPSDDPIRAVPGAVLSSHKAGSVAEAYYAIGRHVADDLELIARGLPPQRGLQAQPELLRRMNLL